jgi:hypothetical protein
MDFDFDFGDRLQVLDYYFYTKLKDFYFNEMFFFSLKILESLA